MILKKVQCVIGKFNNGEESFMKYGLVLFLFTLIFGSCAEKSKIEPIFQAKSFYEATNGKPIKLIIPLTNKTMDRIDAVTSTEGHELTKAKWYQRVWEGAKGFIYNIGAKLGLAKLRISIEHSLMGIDKNGNESGLTPEIIRDSVKSVKISKVFFTFKSPCESRPNDQECIDWSGIFNSKNKKASFDMIKKVFINMSLKDRRDKISEEVSITDSIADIYKEKNEKLLLPQLDLTNSEKLALMPLPQDYNLGYYTDTNETLEKKYTLKSSKHSTSYVYSLETKNAANVLESLFVFLTREHDLEENTLRTILKNEVLLSDKSLLIDLNNLKNFRSSLKTFSKNEEIKLSTCSKFRCLKTSYTDRELRRNTQYLLKTHDSLEDNVVIIINKEGKKLGSGFIKALSSKLELDEDLLKDVLSQEVVEFKRATLIDFNRFPEFKDEFIDRYQRSKNKIISSCANNQCLALKEAISDQSDNIDHLRLPQDNLRLIYVINVKEEIKVDIKNKILARVASDHGLDPRALEVEMLGNIVPLHDQIIFNLNNYEKYTSSFLGAIKNEQLKMSTCNSQNCLFLGSNKMNLKPLLSQSTSGAIDIYLDVKRIPEVALYLKGYLELEIVLDL